jgi:hypothetical protein
MVKVPVTAGVFKEAALPVGLDPVTVAVVFVIAPEGNVEPEEDKLFGTGPVVLEYGSELPLVRGYGVVVS